MKKSICKLLVFLLVTSNFSVVLAETAVSDDSCPKWVSQLIKNMKAGGPSTSNGNGAVSGNGSGTSSKRPPKKDTFNGNGNRDSNGNGSGTTSKKPPKKGTSNGNGSSTTSKKPPKKGRSSGNGSGTSSRKPPKQGTSSGNGTGDRTSPKKPRKRGVSSGNGDQYGSTPSSDSSLSQGIEYLLKLSKASLDYGDEDQDEDENGIYTFLSSASDVDLSKIKKDLEAALPSAIVGLGVLILVIKLIHRAYVNHKVKNGKISKEEGEKQIKDFEGKLDFVKDNLLNAAKAVTTGDVDFVVDKLKSGLEKYLPEDIKAQLPEGMLDKVTSMTKEIVKGVKKQGDLKELTFDAVSREVSKEIQNQIRGKSGIDLEGFELNEASIKSAVEGAVKAKVEQQITRAKETVERRIQFKEDRGLPQGVSSEQIDNLEAKLQDQLERINRLTEQLERAQTPQEFSSDVSEISGAEEDAGRDIEDVGTDIGDPPPEQGARYEEFYRAASQGDFI